MHGPRSVRRSVRVVAVPAALCAVAVATVGVWASPGGASGGGRSGGTASGGVVSSDDTARLVLSAAPGEAAAVATLARRNGARVEAVMPALDLVAVEVRADRVDDLARSALVVGAGTDTEVRLASWRSGDDGADVVDAIVADTAKKSGLSGKGVDVALIDSGVAPVPALAGRVLQGPDFSTDAAQPNLAGLDGFGHGTHLAGIIAAQSDGTVDGAGGVAQGARVVSVKAAGWDGTTSTVSILRSIDWVIENRDKGGRNIRVLNLSFGVDLDGVYKDDLLAAAVEKAWAAGIVVVVAAGNDGATAGTLTSPAHDPFVIAVGATDTAGTPQRADDVIAPFSSVGDGTRDPDVVAPGAGVLGPRVQGSVLDESYPTARRGAAWFRGSGTSQAAAVVSGAVALLLESRPKLTPDEVKAILRSTADPLPQVSTRAQGAGLLDVQGALGAKSPGSRKAKQNWKSAGKGDPFKAMDADGKLKKGKGIQSVESEGDLQGNRWQGNRWQGNRWQGNRWQGNGWD